MKKNGPLFRETICTCQTQFQMSRRGRTTVSQFSWNASYCAISLVCLVKQHVGWVMFWTSKRDTKGFLSAKHRAFLWRAGCNKGSASFRPKFASKCCLLLHGIKGVLLMAGDAMWNSKK